MAKRVKQVVTDEASGFDAGDEVAASVVSDDGAGTEPTPIPPPTNVQLFEESVQTALREAVDEMQQIGREAGQELIAETASLTSRLAEVAAWPASQAKLEKLAELREDYRLVIVSSQLQLAHAQQNAASAVVNVAVKLASNGLLALLA